MSGLPLRHVHATEATTAAKSKPGEVERGADIFDTMPGDPLIAAGGRIPAADFRAGVNGFWSALLAFRPNRRRGNPGARVLTTKKANYGGIGGEIGMTWRNGVFLADKAETGLDRMAKGAKAERVFLKLLRLFDAQGRYVSLDVCSHGLMVRAFLWNGGKPYGTNSSWKRHDHARRPSFYSAIASLPLFAVIAATT